MRARHPDVGRRAAPPAPDLADTELEPFAPVRKRLSDARDVFVQAGQLRLIQTGSKLLADLGHGVKLAQSYTVPAINPPDVCVEPEKQGVERAHGSSSSTIGGPPSTTSRIASVHVV